MSAAAWVFLAAWAASSLLLFVALGSNSDLAKENRRLRRALAAARHPARVLLPGREPIFESTLAEIRALDEVKSPGGAA